MSFPDTTIILPYAGAADYSMLAVDSMIRYSRVPMRLMILVEPFVKGVDAEWPELAAARWPGPVEILRHEKRQGFYGGINLAVKRCPTPAVIVFTTDQVASPGWDTELLLWLKPNRFVTGRLIESGASLIADGTIWKNFGYSPVDFDEDAFLAFCRGFKPPRAVDIPRHYLPLAFFVDDFVRAGMYDGGLDTTAVSTRREDLFFFLRALEQGFEVVEAQKALTYHFQHGSKRTKALLRRHLNWVYPFGLKYLHRAATGYVSLYDTLKARGAAARIDQILRQEKTQS